MLMEVPCWVYDHEQSFLLPLNDNINRHKLRICYFLLVCKQLINVIWLMTISQPWGQRFYLPNSYRMIRENCNVNVFPTDISYQFENFDCTFSFVLFFISCISAFSLASSSSFAFFRRSSFLFLESWVVDNRIMY